MRKFLSLIVVMALSVSLFAQKQSLQLVGAKKDGIKKTENLVPTGSPAVRLVKPIHNTNKGVMAISKVQMGMSVNPFTLLLPTSTCLTANTDLNLITFVARTNSATYAGNHVGAYFSTDGGLSFNDSLVEPWQIPVTGYNARYPSGGIYNPAGNTDPANAYVVTSGPMIVPSTGTWGGAFFGSQKFDATNLDQQFTLFATDTAGGTGNLNTFPREFFQIRSENAYVLGNANTDDGTNYTAITAIFNKGAFNSTNNNFDWTRVAITPDFALSAGLPDGNGSFALVMGDNGTDGYVVFVGRNPDATDTLTFQPIIYKTTDNGATWTKQAFDWENITVLQDLAAELSPVTRPMVTSPLDVTVDNNGYVHIAAFVHGAFSDHPDSLSYYAVYTLWKGLVYDIHQTATGWDAFVVDTVFATDVDDYPFAAITTDERFQMSRTEDGSKLAYAWLDTDPTLDPTNKFADLMVKMYDCNTGLMTEKVNVTKNTELDATCFWMYLSDYLYSEGNGLYTIPVSVSEHGAADTDPVTHYYINGIQFQFTGVNTAEFVNSTVSVYPNPATELVNVAITSRVNDNFTINVYNTVSSLVMTKQISVYGNATQTIDVTTLPSGLYMIEVIGSNGTTTRKMIKK